MALSSHQILNKGNLAFKRGNFKKAKQFYKIILRDLPNHSDANHNLGVIAVSVNKNEEALSLFKNALKANPKIEQFWVSYIDTLIKEKHFEYAKEVIDQAKNQGFNVEKLHAMKTNISSTNKEENKSPRPTSLFIVLSKN